MPDQMTIPIARPTTTGARATESSFTDLATEIQDDMYRRLGGVALVYAGTWLANYAYYIVLRGHDIEVFWHVISAACIGAGVVVYLACRKRRVPPRAFGGFAAVFEVIGGLGIMAGAFGWEHQGEEMLERVAGVVGIPPGEILDGLVMPLAEANARILYSEGVSWVAVWLLVYPFVVPAPMGRTVLATLLTAATVPAVLGASLLINGIPETTRPWVGVYMLDATVPTFICAGIAIAGSRVVFKLTRDLSRAKRMGSYQLAEKIGEGGMGEVWKARHRMLVRPAAIKLVRSTKEGDHRRPSETALKRFQREAQATAELSSPHSIELYDFGITDDGTFYYVMELLKGVDLRTLVEKHGPVPAERAIHILQQACHSLSDAHLSGLIHRDIKPGNLFVCRSGSDLDHVKVLDFGLVKHVDDVASNTSHLTVEGIAGGTPAFMAPEMATDHGPVDGRADLYALGCVGYWLLTGALVFEGDTAVSMLVQHVKDEAPLPSTRTELAIPADVEQLVMACLEKDPNDRPADARELSERLAACARELRPWSEDRALRWWQTNLPQFCRPIPSGSDPVASAATRS